jgi:hypothetical protein
MVSSVSPAAGCHMVTVCPGSCFTLSYPNDSPPRRKDFVNEISTILTRDPPLSHAIGELYPLYVIYLN